MLTDIEANELMDALKELSSNKTIEFPSPGGKLKLEAKSTSADDKFIIDANRGSIKVTKCTYQTRHQTSMVLLRLDIDGPEHTNPDGEVIQCPHLHIYREGFGTSWAHPIDPKIFTDTDDLVKVLFDFLEYNNIIRIPNIQGGGLV
jgi:hypothetical protein